MSLYKNSAPPQFFIGLLILLAACNSKPEQQQQPAVSPPPVVDAIIAQTSSVSNIIEANGTVVANEYVELHPEVSGRLIFLNIPEGNFVQQGTVLARINDADLQAQLNKTKVQLILAQLTEERLHKLLDISGVNQADYDAAFNEVNGLKADISYTQALIDKTVVKAPFSGVMGLRMVSPGAYVTSATVLAGMQQVNKLKIDFTLPEAYENQIKKGTLVEVETAASKTRYKAIVIATEPQVNSDTRNITVRAMLENGKASPGSFVKVYVTGAANKNSIMVPANAIIPDAKKNKVVLIKNGKAFFADIETGVRDAGSVEITKGVAAGDTVVISGVLFARPDKPVQLRSIKSLKEAEH